ncbi:MAG: NADAR family protein [Methanosphaera sp.]|nr:NADAR family protein [Methanosphaera sp.]
MSKKYIAPPWIKYPTQPNNSRFWLDGSGAEYLIKFNKTVDNMDEYLELFPKSPSFTMTVEALSNLSSKTIDYLESDSKPIFINLWRSDAKPKYNLDLETTHSIIMYDTLLSDNSSHIHIGKYHYDSISEVVNLLESEIKEESSTIWDELKYTVYLNSLYYKVSSDINFIKELTNTADYDILFYSDNLEWGVEKSSDGKLRGENLFGLAMMEVRDELSKVYSNYDLIDWDISGDPYSKEHCSCMHQH